MHSNSQFTLDKFFRFMQHKKTKRQKKRFCAKISQNPFVYCFLLTSCPAPPRVVSRGVGKIQIPHAFWFFFAIEKEHHSPLINPQNLVIQKNCNHVNKPQEWNSNNQNYDCKNNAQCVFVVGTFAKSIDNPQNVKNWKCEQKLYNF